MPIVTRFNPDGNYTLHVLCCDCGREIPRASDGVMVWRPGEFNENRPVIFAHRDCALALEVREGGAFCSDELLWFPTRLGRALSAWGRLLEPAPLPHRDMPEG